jgi:hypothetical protein
MGVLVGRGGIIIMQCSMLDGEIIDFSTGEWIWGKRVILIYYGKTTFTIFPNK